MNKHSEFDPNAISVVLVALSKGHRIAFCGAVAERLIPNYEAFSREEGWGNIRVLRKGLNTVWDCAVGASPSQADVVALLQECDSVTPEPGEFDSDLASAALDAANAVSAALSCCVDGDPAHCADVATYARDTVDMYVQIRGDVDSNDPDLEAKIRTHPLMIHEMERQRSDLRLLQAATDLEAAIVQRLKGTGESNLSTRS